MIQLQDVECTVINPLHIIYLNVSSNPVEHDFKLLHELIGQMTTIVERGKEFAIIGEITCVLTNCKSITLHYASVEAFKSDYHKLLTAKTPDAR